MTTMNLPVISSCSVDGCSYNHDHDCHAGAITVTDAAGAASGVEVGAGADRADCLTFAPA